MRELVGLLLAGCCLVGGVASAAPQPEPEVVTRFADPEIVESSGLVATASHLVTVNDSGDSSRIFTVDRGTGETVGVTRWAGESVDNEALAPAGPGEVWVADIGDNRGERSSVRVTRVPFGPGERDVAGTAYDLVYEDGPHDAEALLAHPVTGRLYVVTKDVLGGGVYAAPRRLADGGPNRLVRVAEAPPLVTDGAFLASGRRVVLRSYGRLVVATFPGMRVVASASTPPQEQGEGLAVDGDGSVLLSSEGVGSEVLRVPLPEAEGPGDAESAAPDGPADPTGTSIPRGPGQPTSPEEFRPERWPWVAGTLFAVAALVVLLLALRPR